MKINNKIPAIIMACSMLLGSAFTDVPLVSAQNNVQSSLSDSVEKDTNSRQSTDVTYKVTPKSQVNNKEWEAKNDPLYAKYNSSKSEMYKAPSFTRATNWGEGLTHDPRFDNYNKVYGIDVSKWQGDIDWTAVASDGITFAMIKCGGGDDEDGVYEDRYFRRNIEGALANGIQVGVYFFSGATNSKEAYDEASYCINLIKDYKITYPVAFDWELGYGDYNEVTEACETFCNVVKSYGYTPMVYSSRNGWYNSFDGERLASKYKVWMAAYFGKFYYDSVRWKYGDDLPNFRYNFDMWQYSSRCYVSGIDGFVDVNIAFFGYANYHVDTKDAVITVTNTDIKRTYNPDAGELTEELNLLDGVKGTNSIGYDTEVEYSIYDDEGNEYSEADAISRAGVYTVEYRFKDPKSGWIKNTARLEIIVMSVEKESTQQETKEEV